jgi:hypothetical protein
MLLKVIMQNVVELEPFEFAIDESMKQLSCCWYLVPLHIITENKWISAIYEAHIIFQEKLLLKVPENHNAQ